MESERKIPKLTKHLSDYLNILPTTTASLTKLLVGTVFVGEYIERHYVDSLATYRDLVVVGPEETNLRETLLEAINIVRSKFEYNVWFGVTGNQHDRTPKGYCLWVNLSQIPLGKHWFQIESVDSRAGEILLKLKYLRSFDTKSKSTVPEPESPDFMENLDLPKFFQGIEWPKLLNHSSHLVLNASIWCLINLKNVLTYRNITEMTTFSCVLILAVGTFLIEALKFLSEYSIKLIHEFSFLIRSLMPLFLAIIDFISKCVGGFFLLLYMMWRGSTGGPIPVNALEARFSRTKAIEYTDTVRQPRGRFSNAL